MSDNGCLFTFYTLTPLHVGAGESADDRDLPVQREVHTEYPVVYSHSMKGNLRRSFECDEALKGYVDKIFGKEDHEDGSGLVIFTDAKILLFPVRSSEGVFKWVTCPFVIKRFVRDLKFLQIYQTLPPPDADGQKGFAFIDYERDIVLEDYVVAIKKMTNTTAKLFKKLTDQFDFGEGVLEKRLIIVSDTVFKTLVTNATQTVARNKLNNDTKKSENLWFEEVVPPDAVFYTIMLPTFTGNGEIGQLRNGVGEKMLQIGGGETVGYGLVTMSTDLSGSLLPGGVTK